MCGSSIWGAIHGGMLAFERFQGKDSPYRRLPRPLRVGITFAIVCMTWVFFRAPTLPQALEFIASLFGTAAVSARSHAIAAGMYSSYHMLTFLLAAILVWGASSSWTFSRRITPARAGFAAGILALSVFFMWTQSDNPFIYFQF